MSSKTDEVKQKNEEDLPISNFHAMIPGKTRVLLGMSGGEDSTVAAFLLKKQNIQVEGVAFVFYDPKKIIKSIDERIKKIMADSGGVLRPDIKGLSDADKTAFLRTGCSVDDLEQVKKVCDQLQMPFYAVKAEEEFEGEVFDFIISERLQGRSVAPCLLCNQLKLRLLYEKAKMLKCDFVATGHYAKVYRSKELNGFVLNASNDTKHDQSYFLSFLKQEYLERLILPLSDLKKVDVQRLLERYKFPVKQRGNGDRMCFVHQHSFSLYVESMSPPKYINAGPIYHAKNQLQIGEHQGIHQFYFGDELNEQLYKKLSSYEVEENIRVKDLSFNSGTMVIDFEENLVRDQVGVKDLYLVDSVNMTRPCPVFVKTDICSETYSAVIFFKNNEQALIKFEKAAPHIYFGQVLCFYSAQAFGRVLGHGVVEFIGPFDHQDRLEGRRKKDEDDEGEVMVKVNIPFDNTF